MGERKQNLGKYESHDSKEVTLFATESFTFRVMEEKAIVVYT